MSDSRRNSNDHQEIDIYLLIRFAKILLPLSLITAFLVGLTILEF